MQRPPPPQVGDFKAEWKFYGAPLTQMPVLSALKDEHRLAYLEYLQEPCTVENTMERILYHLWNFQPEDPEVVKDLFLTSTGYFSVEEEDHISSDYNTIKHHLFGSGKIPATSIGISIMHRLLRRVVNPDTGLLQSLMKEDTKSASLGLQLPVQLMDQVRGYRPQAPPSPDFTVWVKLIPTVGHQLDRHLPSEWTLWLRPQEQYAFVFADQHWYTLGLFREVLDAILGRHLERWPQNLEIYRDKECSQRAQDSDALVGKFYIPLNGALAKMPPFAKSNTPPQSQRFPTQVKIRAGFQCAFSSSMTQPPGDDLEAAHIFPRAGHRIFIPLLSRWAKNTRVNDIDHQSNGICLWGGIRRPWDGHRAAITRGHLILARPNYPLSLLHSITAKAGSLEDDGFPREMVILLKLRFTQTMLAWFASCSLRDLLASLGSPTTNPKMEELGNQMDNDSRPNSVTTKVSGVSVTVSAMISPSNSNSSDSSMGISETLASTVPTSPPSSPTGEDPANAVMQGMEETVEQDHSESDDEEELEVEKAVHLPNCFCDVEADPDAPCILLLFGATQLWTALTSGAEPTHKGTGEDGESRGSKETTRSTV